MTNLEQLFKDVDKKYGKGELMWLGDQNPIACNKLSTGSLLVDKILGGGIGYGRITEIYGAESSGKSTLALQIAAQCQQAGGTVMYIDTENALDLDYARVLGVDTNKVLFSQPETAEIALDLVKMGCNTGEINLIIVDSVAALVPEAVLNGEIGDVTIGLLARLMSKVLGQLATILNDKNCALIFINQIRAKINTGFQMGNPETTTGGNALKYFASQRIELRKADPLKEHGEQIGQNVKFKIVKNKLAAPMQTAVVPMIYGKGFSAENEAVDLGIEYGFIEKSGSWFVTTDGQRFQGKENVKSYYAEHHELAEELRERVKAELFKQPVKQEYEEYDPETGEIL